jgi:hypothetical protein
MFDYQAGEKYKLTLIMVGAAGVMAGAFFTLLLSPPGEAPQQKPHGRGARGGAGGGAPATDAVLDSSQRHHRGMRDQGAGGPGPQSGGPSAAPAEQADKAESRDLVANLLPIIFDFNSVSANRSQEQAMASMTPECATLYRQNVWTAEVAQGVAGASMTSTFTPSMCEAYTSTADGSVVIKVEGEQVLNVQGQQRPKHVSMEYLVKKTPQGLKICGISESGS